MSNNENLKEKQERWKVMRDDWERRAKTEIHSVDDLAKFANELVEHAKSLKDGADFYNDTSSIASSLSLAATSMCSYLFGMTLFQMGYVLWTIIDKMFLDEHDVGMRLVNFNNMLYPQYEYRFEKTIDSETWNSIQKKAAELIENGDIVGGVRKHLQSIVDGKVPFGYKVEDNI